MGSPLLSVRAGTVESSHPLREGSATMVLLRHLLGDVLRRLRLRQGRTLREVSAAARVSLGYLSEVERGQEEASSELLDAICTALGTPLSHVLGEVSDSFALAELQSEPVLAGVGQRAAGQSAGNGLDCAERDLDAAVAESLRPAGQPELRIPAGRGARHGFGFGTAPGWPAGTAHSGGAGARHGFGFGTAPGRAGLGSPSIRRGGAARARRDRHGASLTALV